MSLGHIQEENSYEFDNSGELDETIKAPNITKRLGKPEFSQKMAD